MKYRVAALVSVSLCLGCPGESPSAARDESAPASGVEEKTYPAQQLDRAKAEAEAATKALETRNANIDRASATP